MKKLFAVFLLCFVAGIFMLSDYFMNDYERFLAPENNYDMVDLHPQSDIPHEFFVSLPEGVEALKPIASPVLFSKLPISGLDVASSFQTPLVQGDETFGIIYEYEGGPSLYFQIRASLEMILEKHDDLNDDTLFDANNLGDYAVYYNDESRPDTVFLVSLVRNRVWAFEYKKENHEVFKRLTKTLVEKEKIE
ncbi:hypothetical protein COB57_03915 [Candidatus Peregrinibacteria bacterium]|nr:MAG: hypothetical protein COB57_03915 [Candidatus Peregrinibacteria bacterium]